MSDARSRATSEEMLHMDSSRFSKHQVGPSNPGKGKNYSSPNSIDQQDSSISLSISRHNSSSAHNLLAPARDEHQNPRLKRQEEKTETIVTRLNKIPALKRLGDTVRGSKVQSVTFMAVIWALFAQDVCFGWIMDKDIDTVFVWITVFVFVVLSLEMTCHAFLTVNYFGSYFMIIDLVGTALLVPEIFIYASSDDDYASDNTEDSILSVARAGRVARTAAMVRVGRIAKVFRVLRTARAMQCLLMLSTVVEAHKKASAARSKREKSRAEQGGSSKSESENSGNEDDYDDESPTETKPSAFGLKYANLVSQRVVIGVLLILAVVPQLDVTELDYSRERSIDVLHTWASSCYEATNSANEEYCRSAQQGAVLNFLDKFDDCVYLDNHGVVEFEDKVALKERRKTVMTRYTAGYVSDDATASTIVAIFDDQTKETEVRIMNILLTLFVVVIFSVGSWIFNNDAKVMIIRPIERLSALVKKLAGMVFMLSAEEEGDTSEEGNEMDFIDLIAHKMSDVFENDVKMDKKAKSVSSSLIPSTLGRRPSSGLLQNPKVYIGEDTGLTGSMKSGESADADDNSLANAAHNENLVNSRNELVDLKACLGHQKARSYFRLFLSREFNVENIAFWEAVTEYKDLFRKRAKSIYKTYISQAALSQVNIPAKQRAAIKKILMDSNGICDAAMFDLAHEEIFRLMARDPYPRFLKSDLAITYAKIAAQQDRVDNDMFLQDQDSTGERSSGKDVSGRSERHHSVSRRTSKADLIAMIKQDT